MEMLNKIFTTDQIPAIDRYTIEHEPIKSVDLMERAARAWTRIFLKNRKTAAPVAVIAGNGNNGGDGFAIARLLQEEGIEVTVFHLAGSRMSGDCKINYERWKGRRVEVNREEDFSIAEGSCLIDAIFGSGLNRPVTGLPAAVIRKINRSACTVFAVDLPSGLMGEDNAGNDREAIVRADFTLTFQFPKLAFMFGENAGFVGEWQIVDIGLHPGAWRAMSTPYRFLTGEKVAELLPLGPKFAHKGTNGHGLLIAGSEGMMGAVVLAAKAAIRSGIGLLTCHVPGGERQMLTCGVAEALTEADDCAVCFSGTGSLEKYKAIGIGPGIGRRPATVLGMKKMLQIWRGPLVLDADALNILAENRELLEMLPEGSLLTPHPGEFERLVGKSENDFDRLNKLGIFANRYKLHVLLKGAHSVVAFPSGEYWFNTTGNPGMAKGGMGDVLTGMILALLANGMHPGEALCTAVYAHGLAGDRTASEWGERGVCAGSVTENLGKAWLELEMLKRKTEYIKYNINRRL